jgi:hypothetical protein
MTGVIDRPYLDPGTACQRRGDQERHHQFAHAWLHWAENTEGYAPNAVRHRWIPIGIRCGLRLRCCRSTLISVSDSQNVKDGRSLAVSQFDRHRMAQQYTGQWRGWRLGFLSANLGNRAGGLRPLL